MSENPLCRYLEWDSEFFGRRIARITPDSVGVEDLRSILTWSECEKIDCLYYLADAADQASVRSVESFGFELVDLRITFDRTLKDFQSNGYDTSGIRQARETDIPSLKAIAKVSHVDSRFYYDGRFPRQLCDALYETWIEKSCKGYANIVFVPDHDGIAAGYVTCTLSGNNLGQIGLLGVAQEAQGRQWGQKLINKALHWFREQKVDRVLVPTQGRNIRAQRFYEKCGFITQSLQLSYHKWFSRANL